MSGAMENVKVDVFSPFEECFPFVVAVLISLQIVVAVEIFNVNYRLVVSGFDYIFGQLITGG